MRLAHKLKRIPASRFIEMIQSSQDAVRVRATRLLGRGSMKTCPHCKSVVVFYYGMYRCSNCSVWLCPDEVVSDIPHRSTPSESADSTPIEVRERSTKSYIASKPSK
jgi:uncharacterized Zn finger protein (UPF0148 family)